MANDERIWQFLKSYGLNDYGAAGLMGNLYAESGLNPQNLQNTYEKKLGYSDASYTAAVDNGFYSDFVHDSAGYGLAQWTFWSRKQALLNHCKAAGASIGDLDTQLSFLMKELSEGYSGVLSTLRNATSVLEASNAVLLQFERPADQSQSTQSKRAGYGQTYYDKFAGTTTEGVSTGMSNSSLVAYTKISPNRSSPRNHSIDRISIHCVVGQVSIESLGAILHRLQSRHLPITVWDMTAESVCTLRKETAHGVPHLQRTTTGLSPLRLPVIHTTRTRLPVQHILVYWTWLQTFAGETASQSLCGLATKYDFGLYSEVQ